MAVTVPQPHASVLERYFTQRFLCDVQGNIGEDYCILFHSNRICVVTLAQSHPLFERQNSLKIVDINFQASDATDRSQNTVVGKGKRGAQVLTPDSILCKVTCDSGHVFNLRACLKGKLIEVNQRLRMNPRLLQERPQTNGYIAVLILKNKETYEEEFNRLLTEESYKDVIAGRI